MVKNMKAANINGDIVGCKQCIPKGRPTRYIIPDFQPNVQNQCGWCNRKITKNTIGKTFTRIGRIDKGVTRYFNGKKKLVDFEDLTTDEKSSLGLTANGNQKESKRRY
jgi:hypothetical protein